MYMHKFQLMIEFGLRGCGGPVLLVTLCTYFIKQTCQHFYRSNSVTAVAGGLGVVKAHLLHSYRAFRRNHKGCCLRI